MSRYLPTSGSFFEPFGYDELVKPLVQMTEAHNAAQEKYDQLSTETQALKNYISEDGADDERARQMYNDYMAKLQALQEDLYNNGYTSKTARNLSAARNAYASDITRLAAAVKARQDRSKEYWDAVQKDRDLVVGTDPGLSGLDKYLDDDNYGRNWYSYKGNDFTREVGEEAKALSKQLFDPLGRRTLTNSEAPEYYLSRIQHGFTDGEVNNAFAAVRNSIANGLVDDNYNIDKSRLSKEEGTLADTIMSHMVSSGALQTKDPEIIEKMLRYAKAGAQNAIGETKVDYLSKNADLWGFKDGKGGSGGGGNPDLYLQTSGEQWVEGDNAAELSDTVGKYLGKVSAEKPVSITLVDANGKEYSKPFYNQAELDKQIYHNSFRDDIINRFGLDVTKGAGQSVNKSIDGNQFRLKTQKLSKNDITGDVKSAGLKEGDVGVYLLTKNGKWVLSLKATIDYNKNASSYERYINNIRDINKKKGIDIDDYALTPKEEEKLREKFGIDSDVPYTYIGEVAKAKNPIAGYLPAIFVGENTPDKIKEKVVNQLRGTHAKNGADQKYMYRKIKKSGQPSDEYLSFDDVFDDKVKHFGLISVTALPSQYGQNLLQVNTTKGSFVVDSHAFHDNVFSKISASLRDNQVSDGTIIPGLTEYIADINDPSRVFKMNDAEDKAYTRRLMSLIDPAYSSTKDYGNLSAKRLLSTEQGRTWLHDKIVSKMNLYLGKAREEIANLGQKVESESGTSYMGE